MSSRGGARKGAGRKAGTRNKKTAAKLDAIKASGQEPLEYMLSVMRDDEVDERRRDDMAKSAAPYVHGRLASIEHTGKDGGPIETKSTDPRDIARAFLAIVREIPTE